MATIEVSDKLYRELDQFYSASRRLRQLDGQRLPLIELLDLIEAARQDEPTVTLPGPDGEPNVEVPQEGWLD